MAESKRCIVPAFKDLPNGATVAMHLFWDGELKLVTVIEQTTKEAFYEFWREHAPERFEEFLKGVPEPPPQTKFFVVEEV